MADTLLIAFDRKLAGAVLPGQGERLLTESELSARAQDAFRRGVDSARALADQQMVEFRADVSQLSDGVLKKVGQVEKAIVSQLNAALPSLGVEIARRLLAGYEPPAEVVAKLCDEALSELFPEKSDLELVVSPRDADILQGLHPSLKDRYPGLRISSESSLVPGDCQVRSRFGLIDGRMSTKLMALENSLVAV
ncbi:MAG TPA: FliH/SctL family protein [Opitutaceae bacterium]|jgi:flagellar assembly protein FliH|nr:FliH/SctL family protein [Opitutaceae bacterium]